MIKIIVSGACGHMGKVLRDTIDSGYRNSSFFSGIDCFSDGNNNICKSFKDLPDGADCIIDFSNHSCTSELVNYAVSKKLPLVIATTGQTQEEIETIKEASSSIPVFLASNYSIGVTLLVELAVRAAAFIKDADIEIVETHHNRKLDAPSGTALTIAKAVQKTRDNSKIVCSRTGMSKRNKNDIGISSVRCGNITGIHEVIIASQNETITLKHEAYNRTIFAEGAIAAAQFLVEKNSGLYSMNDLLSEGKK